MLLYSNIIGEGKPFIILHGFLGMSDNWKTHGLNFSKLGYQVHLVDQRNHGRSFHSDEFNYELLAKDLLNYINHYNLKDCILLGHSMGGKTVMQFAANYPEYIQKLIVADISPKFYPVHHDKILEGLSALDFTEIKSRGTADKVLSNYVQEQGVRQFLLKNLFWVEKGELGLRLNLEALTNNVSEVGEALEVGEACEVDALFLRGSNSEYVLNNDFDLIQKLFAKSKIENVSNAGHWLHAENPKEFSEKVLSFIQKE
jgi:esterase